MQPPALIAQQEEDQPWVIRVSALFFIAYMSFILWIPKLGVGVVTFYIFEPLAIALIAMLAFEGRLTLVTRAERFYLAFMLICLIAFVHGAMKYGTELKPFLIIVKYTLFGFYIACGYMIARFISRERFVWIIGMNLVFLTGNIIYVLWNTSISGLTLQILVGEWNRSLRLVGWTGMALKFEGIEQVVFDQIQTTSVPMGVFCGLLALLCLILYFYERRVFWLLGALIAAVALQLTYARSGLVVLGIGTLLLLVEVRRNLTWLPILVLGVLGILAVFTMTDAASLLGEYGTLGKVQQQTAEFTAGRTSSKRIEYWMLGLEEIDKNPLILLFGVGYGDHILVDHVGGGTLESLVFDALFQTGVTGLILLLLVFLSIWRTASLLINYAQEDYVRALLSFYIFSVPGLLISNTVGGNQLQTDFIAPLYFVMFGVCVGRTLLSAGLDISPKPSTVSLQVA